MANENKVVESLIEWNVTANKRVELEESDDPDALEWTSEEQLVEQARSGDREAFGELVRRHRGKALGWAMTLSHDIDMAEDIVQDALIGAFLHVGTLADVSRFQSWFRRIVQNQANHRLRRGGPYGKERPFTSIEGHASPKRPSSWDNTDWQNIDSILFHFSQSLKARHSDEVPEAKIVRLEIVEGIRSLLGCLSKHERNVFEAHFFRQLPPSEIAFLFGTSTANVYTLVSRSRSKVQKERIRIYFRDVSRIMTQNGQTIRRVLTRPFDF